MYNNISQHEKSMSNIKKIQKKSMCAILLVLFIAVTVNQSFAQTEENDSSLIIARGISSDGSVHVTITSTPIELHKPLALQISFTDSNGNKILNENYGITALQQETNGVTILSNYAAFAKNGEDIQVTRSLDNTSPVNFQIQLQGSGIPGTDSSTWKGPQGDTVGITMVPEFGSIVSIILGISFMITIFWIKRSHL